MSAFIVEPETFTRIYSGFRMFKRTMFEHSWGYMLEACKPWQQETDHDEITVCRALYQMNVNAVNQRYGDETSEMMLSPYLKACVLDTSITEIQFLKSLHCIEYQMSEGDVPKHPVYLALEKIIHSIEYRLATRNIAYDMAIWG